MRIALITGASSGMGEKFALRIAREERDIDEIWLIARRKERLDTVAGKLSCPARVLPLDLTEKSSFDEIGRQLGEADAEVGLLVNCAGYGKIGNYAEISRFDSINMIDLNCSAAVNITLSALPYMKAGDRIIQICSTAAFQPLQHINIYAASKSFLYHYSRALRMELLPRKIAVTAVCPFWVKDTEFIAIAKGENAAGTGDGRGRDDNTGKPPARRTGKPPIRHFLFATTADHVAGSALKSSRRGSAVCTPGLFCTIDRIFAKILPRESLIWIWELFRRI